MEVREGKRCVVYFREGILHAEKYEQRTNMSVAHTNPYSSGGREYIGDRYQSIDCIYA
jgi:hypothetical protein